MEYNDTIQYLNEMKWSNANGCIQRMSDLLRRLGDPQKGRKYIYVAGSNGKGSASAMLSAALKSAGYKTGWYTTSHLYEINERIRINGIPTENSVFAKLVSKVKAAADSVETQTTGEEIMIVSAVLWCAAQGCDVMILEAENNEKDAVYALEQPIAMALMNLASEKDAEYVAAAISPGCSCVSYEQPADIRKILIESASKADAELIFADFRSIQPEFDTMEGQVFTYKGVPCAISLPGDNQRKNAVVVLELCTELNRKGFELDQSDVEHGLYAAACPARFEQISDEPPFVLDGGMNVQSAETVRKNLLYYFPEMPRILLLGATESADLMPMMDVLADTATEFVCTTPAIPGALPAQALAALLQRYGKPVTVCEQVKIGVNTAQDLAEERNGMVCAVCAAAMAGDIRTCFNL